MNAVQRPTEFQAAIKSWKNAIGEDNVALSADQFNIDTSSYSKRVPAILSPKSVEQVQSVVRIAQERNSPIYPVSTGRNWGYGTSVPCATECAIVELSALRKVLDFDDDLGVATIEPGVTQRDLASYLDAHNLKFMVPVTGGGPNCSVLANALERGFGVTPRTDHFAAVMSLKAVLPDGSIFESYSRAHGSAGFSNAFRYGTGPHLDSLFSQSNFGIVVNASIALAPQSEDRGILLFAVDDNHSIDEVCQSVKRLLYRAGTLIGGLNLMSRSRLQCMYDGSTRLGLSESGTPVEKGNWFGFGTVYGTRKQFAALRQMLKRHLGGQVRKLRLYSKSKIDNIVRVARLAQKVGIPIASGRIEQLIAAECVASGRPTSFALPLAYAESGSCSNPKLLSPASDRCGLFWYSPIVPLKQNNVTNFLSFARSVCHKHGLQAPVTLTSMSPTAFACTLPVLFDRENPEAEQRATECMEELHITGIELGFVPYRLGSQFMSCLSHEPQSYWPLAQQIKSSLDPGNILAPGRYEVRGL